MRSCLCIYIIHISIYNNIKTYGRSYKATEQCASVNMKCSMNETGFWFFYFTLDGSFIHFHQVTSEPQPIQAVSAEKKDTQLRCTFSRGFQTCLFKLLFYAKSKPLKNCRKSTKDLEENVRFCSSYPVQITRDFNVCVYSWER